MPSCSKRKWGDSASIPEIKKVIINGYGQYESGKWWGWGLGLAFEWSNFSTNMVKHGFIHSSYTSYISKIIK